MRVSPAGWLADSLDQCLEIATRVTAITHNHPEGLKGARATAHAIWLARQGVQPIRGRGRWQGPGGGDQYIRIGCARVAA
jgi:ADP-ribosyl-[dinitrogen reductase] hydrolase